MWLSVIVSSIRFHDHFEKLFRRFDPQGSRVHVRNILFACCCTCHSLYLICNMTIFLKENCFDLDPTQGSRCV